MSDKPQKKYDKTVSFRLSNAHIAMLDEMAAATYSSKASLIKNMIDDEYERFITKRNRVDG